LIVGVGIGAALVVAVPPVHRFFDPGLPGAYEVTAQPAPGTATTQTAPSPPPTAGQVSLPDMLQRVLPGVVSIAVQSQAPASTNPLFSDPFYRRFFGQGQQPQPQVQLSAGSGVIIDAKQGYIVTNNHVVSGGQEIAVKLSDGRALPAQLVGSDSLTDVALLRVKADKLTQIEFGDSSRLRVGDSVVAIGNPFGLGGTVTSGIVSALGRSGLNIEGYEDFIQTDASINPGNSGGALMTLDGRLAGLNTAILAPSGGNVGIGFAVPSNMIKAVVAQLIQHGRVERGQLGVSIQDLTPDLAQAMRVSQTGGAVVAAVSAGSPAEKAGLKPRDVIVAVNNQSIRDSAELRNTIGLTPVGTEVQLKLLRDGKPMAVTATIGRAPAPAPQAQPS
jgi:Do/DeqQ family serine protease